ncbi:bifunctional folylpolyglutamate synthase/dihydrofolate synthase [Hoeflea sp. YIM 152468]|uniref:bifunctional folylpolyglutamate synthase/dihydrofolate synthase n=1 Tax=Hoeflea sp. YIM 152468 TaxID=3031759 RepID=UPI0023DBC79E|nr:folylpolyglutamate synthase/dihydrofolate synthase family protein [Hoeflea sp. YIM 152468]MDF1610458.1 bifunctional folylpolyglutamate synthase/dihydrofolate synthase [Hoeflea sp. YIM 152468]
MALHPKGFDLSLGRIARLLERLGNPHQKLPPVIHIAGTNGKGSTSAFCRAILEAHGLTVHVHTSPHLVNWHERFRLGAEGGGQLVGDAVLADAVRRVADANQGEMITVFEILTAVMFLLFSESPADVALIEVGLGGRFDATNVITNPAVSVIMSISLDHQAYLGDRVELIAMEKAGIIKSGSPVVIGAQPQSAAREVLIETAGRLSCPLSIYGQDFLAFEENGRLAYQDEDELIDLPLPKLAGRHQQANAAAAIRALKAAGFKLDEPAIAAGLLSVSWPGRLERLTHGRLVDAAMEGAELWIDGGHNPGAGLVIAEAMANLNDRESRPLFLIAGMINTKDPAGYFEAYAGMARHVFTVPVPGSDAGLDPAFLADTADEAGLSAEPATDVETAISVICRNWTASEQPPRILICGSLYLLGEVLKANGTPPT